MGTSKGNIRPPSIKSSFKVGDLIYPRNYRPGATWEPAFIVEVMGPLRYKVMLFNEDQLWRCHHAESVVLLSRGIWHYTWRRRFRIHWNLSYNRRFSPYLSTSWVISRRCWSTCHRFHSYWKWQFKENTSWPSLGLSTFRQILLINKTLPI